MNLIDTHNPDIIFGTESWLNPDIHQVNHSQMVTLFIIATEKAIMTVFSLPAENLLLYVV